jgi:phosphoribosyl 1,2-cyclic phosphodiesterase
MKSGIDTYASAGTIEALKLQSHRLHAIHAKKRFSIGTWTILPFEAEHDAAEPLGFLMASTTGEKLLYLTDSFYCRYKFKGISHLMVECNYSKDILAENIKAGIISPAQMKRIYRSHLSLDNLITFLCNSDLSRVQEIHLLHLSNDNSDAARFKKEIEALTGKPTYIA